MKYCSKSIKIICICLFLITLTLISSSCSSYEIDDLQYYVIPRSLLTDGMSNSEIVKVAKNEGRLAFSGQDIVGFNWQKQRVTLDENAVLSTTDTTTQTGGSSLFKVDDTYAYAVILKNSLVYYGGFESGTKNPQVPLQPTIYDRGGYSFSIEYDSKYANGEDTRFNEKLYKFLEKHSLLTTMEN